MSDGKIVIDVDLDSRKAEKSVDDLNSKIEGAFQDKAGRWRAADGRFLTMAEKVDMLGESFEDMGKKGENSLKGIEPSAQTASIGIGKIVTALGLMKLASTAVSLLKSSLDGAITRYDTMNNFPKVMKQLGFSTEESAAAVDKLADGVTGLPTPLNEIVSSAQGLAVMTGDLDGATDTALALNNAFLASGASSADASRGLDQYVQMLAKGEVDMQSWRTLQETMGLALNETAKAFGFTGKAAQNDLYAALQDGSITFDQFNDKLIELDGGVDGFAKRARTASGGIATAFANMRTAAVRGLEGIIRSIDESLAAVNFPSIQQMIENFGKTFENALKKVAAAIPPVINFIANMINILKPFAPIIMGVVAAILTFATGISVINGVNNAIKSLKTGFAVLKAVMMANPILLVVAALVGLGVALYTAYQKSETFRNAVNKLAKPLKALLPSVESIKKVVGDLVGKFMNMISPLKQASSSIDFMKVGFTILKVAAAALLGPIGLVIKVIGLVAKALGGGDVKAGIQSMLDGFSSLAKGVNEAGGQVGASVGDMLAGILKAIGAALPGIISGALSIIAGFLSGLAQGLPQVALAAVHLIAAFTGSMLMLIPTIAASATLIIVTLLGSLAAGLPQIILAGINLLVSLIAGLTAGIPQFVLAVTNLIVVFLASITASLPRILLAGTNLLIAFIQGLIDNLPKIVETVGTLITTFLDAITAKLPSIITSGTNLLVAWLKGIADNLPKVISAAVDVIVSFLNGIAKELPRIVTSAVNLMVSFLQGIANNLPRIVSAAVDVIVAFLKGIASQIGKIVSAAMDLIDAMVRGILQAQGRLTNAIITLMNGMANSINSSAPQMKAAAGNLLRAIINAFPGGSLVTAGFDLMAGLARGIGNAVGSVVSAAVSVAGKVVKSVKGALGIHSPSRVMRDEVGKFIPQGVAVGIEADTDTAVKAMDKMNKKIMMPQITAEAALGIGGRMSTSPNSVMNSNITNNYTKSDNSEIAKLVDEIKNLSIVLDDGTLVGKLGPAFNQYFGNEANLNGRHGR